MLFRSPARPLPPPSDVVRAAAHTPHCLTQAERGRWLAELQEENEALSKLMAESRDAKEHLLGEFPSQSRPACSPSAVGGGASGRGRFELGLDGDLRVTHIPPA